MLHDMLRRILRNMDLSENEIDESIYDAMLLSVDVLMRFILIKRKRWISQICLSWEKAFVSSRRARSRMLRMHRLLLFYVSCVMKRDTLPAFCEPLGQPWRQHTGLDCRYAFAGKDSGYRYTYSCHALSL